MAGRPAAGLLLSRPPPQAGEGFGAAAENGVSLCRGNAQEGSCLPAPPDDR